MAGFGAWHRLREEGAPVVVYDKNGHPGGHTSSYTTPEGFVYDEGPHISFTKNERMQQLFGENVHGAYETIHARVNNYWKGAWVKHPAQCNLHGLPSEQVVQWLTGMIEAKGAEPGAIRHYEDWLVASFGRPFAETFPMQYGRKYHTTPASNMSTEWLGPRLYKPSLQEILTGALVPSTPDVHYISDFRYPTHGGFASYLAPFFAQAHIELNHELAALDPAGRTLTFSNGKTIPYDSVISSVPLPELIARIPTAPPEVVEAARQLACTTCVVVNVGLARADVSDWHWTYFYDDDFCFSRVSFPHMFSPRNAPEGCGSIQAEIYFSNKYKPFTGSLEEWRQTAVRDLRRCGLIRDDDRIVFSNALVAKYANIIFDLDRSAALEIVHGYLDEMSVRYCGRYGQWGYQWTDEAFVTGENAAQRVLDGTVVSR
jgi:protoporphyrinogen oxidase